MPEGISSIIFSIQGNAHGATIDANTSVITPGNNNSGTIVVRAAIEVLPSCYAESNLLIRAHPTTVAGSAVNSFGIYGGGWTHTFNGTGGSLDGVEISETVQTQPGNPFDYYFYVTPGFPNIWTLNAGGTMGSDWYITDPDDINATNFLPSPPKAGLPQTGTDHQWYHWKCVLCDAWRVFTGPHSINVTLMYSGTNLIVRTSAYGQSTDDEYVGPMP